MSQILVTGASGFLGRHLVRRLQKQPGSHTILAVSRSADPQIWETARSPAGGYIYYQRVCDLSNHMRVRALMLDYRPDVVFHLAANPLIKADPNNPFGAYQDAVQGTHHLLEYAPEGCRFVFASSAAVYGDPASPGASFSESGPVRPTSVYGAGKAAGEALVKAYTAQGRVSGTCARLIANVGAWASHGLVRDIVRKLKSDEPTLCLLGDEPGSVKPLAYAGDTADALAVLGLESTFTGHLNLGPEDNLSVHDVARLAMNVTGIWKPITWSGTAGTWKGDNPYVRIDNFCARTLGVWNPKYPTTQDACMRGVKELEALGC